MSLKIRKICVLGYRGIGKTSIIQQYISGIFSNSYDPTIENTYSKRIFVNGNEYEITIIDTAGQDDVSLYPQSYFLGTHGFIIVYSIVNHLSFDMASKIYEKILQMTGRIQNSSESLSSRGSKQSSFPIKSGHIQPSYKAQSTYSYSLNTLSKFPHTPMVLVGNKIDLNCSREVTYQAGQKLAKSWSVPFYEISAKSKKNINDIFETVIREIEKYDNCALMDSSNAQTEKNKSNNCIIN